MLQWKKKGLLFNPKNISKKPEWFHEFAQAPNALIFKQFVRVYFCCRPKPDKNGSVVSYGNYVDLNRKNLFEIISTASNPVMSLGATGTFDEFGTYPISVVKVGSRILAYYGGWTRCESVPFNVAIGVSESFDEGKTFTRKAKGPVLSYSIDEPFVVTSPKIRIFNNVWYLFYSAGAEWFISDGRPEIIYKIRMARSKDGLNWEKFNTNVIEDTLGTREAQASPDVIFKNGIYHLFFCYRAGEGFRNDKTKSYRIGYARSSDLINWKREDDKVGIDVSKDGWDSKMISYPHVFELDGEIIMLYLGNEFGRHGFGLAQLEGELT